MSISISSALGAALLLLLGARASAQGLVEGGFENGAPVVGLPTAGGVWAGDVVQFVAAAQGVTPREGARMVRFVATSPSGASALSGSEVIQLVDLTPSSALVQSGQAVATADAWFNRIAGDAQTDTQFLITVRAYSGSMGSFPVHFNHDELALVDGVLISDALESTWQKATTHLCLPSTTTYVAIRLTAVENVFNDTTDPEFNGHFGDDVTFSLGLVPLAINSYCVGAPNSVGPGASITAIGTTSLAANDFTLVASGGPPNVPGLFFYGRVQGQQPFGDGWRCIQGTTYRLGPPVPTNASGVSQRAVDFTVPPAGSGPGVILPHSSWAFQYWYRNVLGPGGSGFNLTDGVAATFCP